MLYVQFSRIARLNLWRFGRDGTRLLCSATTRAPPSRSPSASHGWLGKSDPLLISSHLSEPEAAGRELAKLSLIANSMRNLISEAASRGEYSPDMLARLETTVEDSFRLVRSALELTGKPCTAEELANRINKDIIAIPPSALDYRDLLRAGELRDELEALLVNLNVMPPRESLIDGAGKPFSRKERREERRKAFEEEEGLRDDIHENAARDGNDAESSSEHRHFSKIPPISPEELDRRQKALSADTKIENILRGFDTALLEISRVHKVTRGGTNMKMKALVVIGNRKGTAGYGEGKSETVVNAIERACRDAKRNLLHVDRFMDRTIFHRSEGKYVQSRVSMWPMPRGHGILANNNFSAVFQLFGINDVGAKLHGPRSISNSVKALFNGLHKIRTAEQIASTRGLRVANTRDTSQPKFMSRQPTL